MFWVEDASINNPYFLVHLLHAEVWTHCAFFRKLLWRREDLAGYKIFLKVFLKVKENAIWYTIETEKLQIARLSSVACWFLLPKFSFTEVETTQKSEVLQIQVE